MLEGKPTIFMSYSGGYEEVVAKPVATRLATCGFKAILVGEEPLPPATPSNPNAKVDWYLLNSEMAVFLATPDDELASGEIRTRQNIIDEHARAHQLEHLKHKLLVFKAVEVKLPSNINPAYERLPLDDPDWIVGKIVAQARVWGVLPPQPAPAADYSPQSSEEDAAPTGTLPGEDLADATADAVGALEHAIRQLHGEPGERRALRRAELAIAGLAADLGSDTLGVHLANKVFADRHDLKLRRNERVLLLRTYLSHTREDNVPGAVWLKDLPRRDVVDLLLVLAQEDGDEAVRAQALLILGRVGAPSSAQAARELVAPFLGSDEFPLRWAGLAYIRARGDASLRDLLDDAALLERDRHKASKTAALLDLRRRPGDVLLRYIDDAYVRRDSDVEDGLLAAASRIKRPTVDRAIRSSVPEARSLGLRLAAHRRCLSLATATEVLDTEKSRTMRLRVVRTLIASGEPVTFDLLERAGEKRDDDVPEFSGYEEQHAAEVELASQLPRNQLEQEIKWSSTGPSLYEAIGRRDPKWVDRNVRRDLANDFKRLRQAWRDEWITSSAKLTEEKLGHPLSEAERDAVERAIDVELSKYASTEAFLVRVFRKAALRVLVEHGKPSDVRFARQFATDDAEDIRVEAVKLFERFGTSHDATAVLAMVDQVYGDEARFRVAETALRLAYKKDKLTTLAKLREDHTVRIWAVERLSDFGPDGVREAWSLLVDDRADVRLAAAHVFWNGIKPEMADEFLSYYMRRRHFYNVVRAIDRRLYAPKWLFAALGSDDALARA